MGSFQEIDMTLPFSPTIYNLNNLSSLKVNQSNSLKLLYLNARSVKNKIEDISNIVNNTNTTIHIIAITETW